MDLNDYSTRQFICENLKNMERLGKSFFRHPFLKELNLPRGIPQPPKFSRHQPLKVLTYLSELEMEDPIHQEMKFNLLLADIFDVEYAFFVHKQDEKNCYLLRVIGGVELQEEVIFTLPMEEEFILSQNFDMGEEIIRNPVFKKAISDFIHRPIKSIKVVNGCPQKAAIKSPFLLVLVNKFLSLAKNQSSIINNKRSDQPIKISVDISEKDKLLIRDVMRLLSPIFLNLLYKDASIFPKWLPKIANRMRVKFNNRVAWVNSAMIIIKKILNDNRVRIHLTKDNEAEDPDAMEEGNESNANKRIIGLDDEKNEENATKRQLFYRKLMKKGCPISEDKNPLCIPFFASGEMLGVFEILRNEDFITSQEVENCKTIVTVCTFGLMLQ